MTKCNLHQRGYFFLGMSALVFIGSCVGSDRSAKVEPQGWTAKDQSAWYAGTQGSRLMPLAWFKALERAEDTQLFADPGNLARFRFLVSPDQALPIGFAADDSDDSHLTVSKLRWFEHQGAREKWVGLNCAACHTAEIAFGDKIPVRVDGAPALVDFQSFTDALDAALQVTRDDPGKWNRFAAAVLGSRDSEDNRKKLKPAFAQFLQWQAQVAELNATPSRYGFGRLDAVGRILNKVALFMHPANGPVANQPDAPVSYPFLWDIWRQNRLQWNGIAKNARLPLGRDRFLDYGALGRNAGEVIGVFGDVDTTRRGALAGFRSSIQTENLDRMEVMLRRLRPPVWPTALFGLPTAEQEREAAARAKRGEVIFKAVCSTCHARPNPRVTRYDVHMEPLKNAKGPPTSPWQADPNRTDPWMACNAYTYNSRSGNLEGVKADILSGRRLGSVEPTGTLLATTVKGTLIGQKGRILKTAATTFFGIHRPPIVIPQDFPDTPEGRRAARLQRCLTDQSEILAYKARPLDGIWATAPYLHNGSVPTLYDLLLPVSRRPSMFRVGTRQFDPGKVGFRTDAAALGNTFVFDTSKLGNSNAGHDYGAAALSNSDRWALVEYLKGVEAVAE